MADTEALRTWAIQTPNEASADWKNGDELYRFKYKLLREDGLTAEEVSWL